VIPTQDLETIAPTRRTWLIVAYPFMLACVICGAIISLLNAQAPPSSHPDAAPKPIWFHLLAVSTLVLSIFWSLKMVPPFDESEATPTQA